MSGFEDRAKLRPAWNFFDEETMNLQNAVAIVTGGMPDVARGSLKATGLDALFPIVVTPADVPAGRGKPAPDMFLLAARRMGVAPGRCLVFEDAEPGIVGARAAGMQIVRVPSRELGRTHAP